MNLQKLITAFLLMLPGLSWGAALVTVPEPGVLALMGTGVIVVLAVQFMRRKK